MNNLNIFLFFSCLIYFKLTEDKKGNVKMIVGLLTLYLFYKVLTDVEEGLQCGSDPSLTCDPNTLVSCSPSPAKCMIGNIDCAASAIYDKTCKKKPSSDKKCGVAQFYYQSGCCNGTEPSPCCAKSPKSLDATDWWDLIFDNPNPYFFSDTDKSCD